MASKMKFKYEESSRTEEQKQNTGMCEVFGCPRKAQVNTGRWNCRYHSGRRGDSLASIVILLKSHETEINWYEKVLNMPGFEFEMLKENAPETMKTFHGETLHKYRNRLTVYVSALFLNPEKRNQKAKYTFADITGDF